MEHMHSHGGLIDHLLEEPLEGLLNSIGLAEKLNHFIVHALMDFLEISLLLLIVVTLVTYLQTYIPFDKMRRKLQKLRGLPGMLLALVLAVASSYRDTPIDAKTLAIGEVGLTGEVRSVTAMQQRLTEAARLGFTRCIVPRHSTKQLLVPEGMELIRVRNIREAIEMAL